MRRKAGSDETFWRQLFAAAEFIENGSKNRASGHESGINFRLPNALAEEIIRGNHSLISLPLCTRSNSASAYRASPGLAALDAIEASSI